MMKPQCLGRGDKILTRRDLRASLVMIIQKPNKMQSTRLSVMSVTDCSEEKVIEKCISERQKSVSEQRGAAQCITCNRWFRSRGGLSVHNCRPDQANET